jgi:hypothetical protein
MYSDSRTSPLDKLKNVQDTVGNASGLTQGIIGGLALQPRIYVKTTLGKA